MKFTVSFLFLLAALVSQAQNSVSGVVLDSLSRQPVPFANVYFAGTTLGVTTDAEGKFLLKGFASGKYDLSASFVGYYPAQRSLNFEDTQHEVVLVLMEKATELAEVIVRPDNRNRPFDLQTFKQNFIGLTKNAPSSKIINESDLDFDYEANRKKFTAYSRKPLELVNDALGYRIIYDLQAFEIDYETKMQLFLGIPRFENLSSKVKGRWERERKRAYYGSVMQFIHLLKSGSMDDEFSVFEFFRKPNPDRPSTAFLKERIRYWSLNQLSANGTITRGTSTSDSLNYYLELSRLPELLDSIGAQVKDVKTLMDAGRNTLQYTGMLYVIYTKEAEEQNYAFQERRPAQRSQTSVIHILQPVKIYENGYFEDTQSLFFEGYMGWAEKLADMLPLGYKPED